MLSVRNLSDTYIEGNRVFLKGFVNTHSNPSPKSALAYLSEYTHLSQNSKARYAGYLKGFLKYLGYDFDLSIKRPHLLPQRVTDEEIRRLKESISNHKPNKSSTIRDLVLVDTGIKTGMRRPELANLLVRHISFESNRLAVVVSKGYKDRIIPIGNRLTLDLVVISDNAVFCLDIPLTLRCMEPNGQQSQD